MRKILIVALALLGITTIYSCGPSKEEKARQLQEYNDSIARARADSIAQVKRNDSIAAAKAKADSIEAAKAAQEAKDQQAIEKITTMFNGHRYNDYGYLEANCTPKLLKKLSADYDYDGGGYAGWDFRSDAQDGPSEVTRIIKVTPLGDFWYRYDYYDMGIRGANKVKLVEQNGKLLFDAVRRL